MATQLKSVLVIGATGVIGQYIIQGFIDERHSFDRLAILTSPSTLEKKAQQIQALKEKGVEIITGDITNKEDVLRAYTGTCTTLPTPIPFDDTPIALIMSAYLSVKLQDSTPS